MALKKRRDNGKSLFRWKRAFFVGGLLFLYPFIALPFKWVLKSIPE